MRYKNKRKYIQQEIKNYDSILEIGPFFKPFIIGEKVKYFDVLNTNELINRAIELGFPTENIPKIDYYSDKADMSLIEDKFDAIFSSHCIEHQPDLIKHFQQVDKLLKQDGKYFLFIPDKRYCFDYFINESTIPEILGAHKENRVTHSLKSVIEHRAYTTHNNACRHWLGRHGRVNKDNILKAMEEYNKADGKNIDVHAWQFTPESFNAIVYRLYSLGFIDLVPEFVSDCIPYELEFCVILKKDSIRNYKKINVTKTFKWMYHFKLFLIFYEKIISKIKSIKLRICNKQS